MRHFPLLALTNVLLGFDLPLRRVAPTSKSMQFPILNKTNKHADLSADRRRSYGLSDQCYYDIFYALYIWCIPARLSCDVLGDDHTKWVIHIDNDIEHMCYPSSCSGNDIQLFYTWEMGQLDSAAKYCTLDCPEIEFNITGTSEDDQKMALSGMYNYADLSYECAGAAAMVEISRCEERGACPNGTNGLTTCTVHFEDKLSYAHRGQIWKDMGMQCLPDECIDSANLAKMEDFEYAWIILQLRDSGLYLTAEEVREWFVVDYSCPTAEGEAQPSKEQKSSQNYSSYVLILGVTSAVLFVLCLLAICMLRIYRNGGVRMTPIISVELNNRETFTAVRDFPMSAK